MVLVAPGGLYAVTLAVSVSTWTWQAVAWVVGILRKSQLYSVKSHLKQALILAAESHDSLL